MTPATAASSSGIPRWYSWRLSASVMFGILRVSARFPARTADGFLAVRISVFIVLMGSTHQSQRRHIATANGAGHPKWGRPRACHLTDVVRRKRESIIRGEHLRA